MLFFCKKYACQITFSVCFQCHEKLKDPEHVSRNLRRIPDPRRTSHMNLMLAQAHDQLCQKKAAIDCYHLVLKSSPFAFDVMVRLVQLGENPRVLLAAVDPLHSRLPLWLEPLLLSHSLVYRQSFIAAGASFAKIDERHPNTLHLLEFRARCDVFSDDLQSAKPVFEKILSLDEGYVNSMDAYGSLLKKTNDAASLNKLSHKLLAIAPNRPETWSAVSMAHSMKYPKQPKVSINFIEKGIRANPLYWFGCANKLPLSLSLSLSSLPPFLSLSLSLLSQDPPRYVQKGWMYLRQSSPEKAVEAFRAALQIESNVFVYTGLIKTKLAEDKLQEAINLATECFKHYPDSPVSLSLLGTCLGRIPDRRPKAMSFFFQALKLSIHSIDAIAGITELLVIERKYSEAIAILEKQLQLGRHSDLIHTRLAEIHHMDGAHGKALEHYHAALKSHSLSRSRSLSLTLLFTYQFFLIFNIFFACYCIPLLVRDRYLSHVSSIFHFHTQSPAHSANPNLDIAKDGLALLSKEVLADSVDGEEEREEEEEEEEEEEGEEQDEFEFTTAALEHDTLESEGLLDDHVIDPTSWSGGDDFSIPDESGEGGDASFY